MKIKGNVYIWLTVAAIVGGFSYMFYVAAQPGEFDDLATCITESGTTFYGAYWCPHCAEQKRHFGRSAKLLPYVECSLPNRAGSTQICIDKKIEGYPTWDFSNGERIAGFATFEQLSQHSNCKLG